MCSLARVARLVVALAIFGGVFPVDGAAATHDAPSYRRTETAPGLAAVLTDTLPLSQRLGQAWSSIGRRMLASNAGAVWDSSSGHWKLDPHWRYADTAVGPFAYYLEQALRPALTVAQGEPNGRLLNELADFYVTYHQRFVTLGALRNRAASAGLAQLLDNQGPDSTLTLGWLQSEGSLRRWRECELCNAQLLHPAARLLNIIASLPPSTRTAAERDFARLYAPLIVDEHLIRLGYVARWSFPDRRLPSTLVASWDKLRLLPPRSDHAYYDAIQDRDLWFIATAAEVLGADKRDHALVQLTDVARQQLAEMVRVGIAMVASRRTSHRVPGQSGQTVAADSYFNGEYDDHPDMKYAGDSGESRPTATPHTAHGRSWDVSHIYRLPVLFRSLIENRAAIGNTFPTSADIDGLVNEYVYVVFKGESRRPLPTNFFDGSDGWYRVGATGGYPPSKYCDARRSDRSCLASEGVLYGWELLAVKSETLRHFQEGMLRLAESTDPADVEFRGRYYTQGGRPFAMPSAAKGAVYSLPVYVLLSAKVDRLR